MDLNGITAIKNEEIISRLQVIDEERKTLLAILQARKSVQRYRAQKPKTLTVDRTGFLK